MEPAAAKMMWWDVLFELRRAVPPSVAEHVPGLEPLFDNPPAPGGPSSMPPPPGFLDSVKFKVGYGTALMRARRKGAGEEEQEMADAVQRCLDKCLKEPRDLKSALEDARLLAWWRMMASADGILPEPAFDASGRLDKGSMLKRLSKDFPTYK